jgi:hypothetical protein
MRDVIRRLVKRRAPQIVMAAPAGSWEADGVSEAAVRIEPLTMADVPAAVELAMRVLAVKPGDRGNSSRGHHQ